MVSAVRSRRHLRRLQLLSLRLSIRHWEDMCREVERAVALGTQAAVNIYGSGCECCRVLKDSLLGYCKACPICEYSDGYFCKGTPWSEVRDAKYVYEKGPRTDIVGRVFLDACLMEYFYLLFVYEALKNEVVG